MITPSQVFDFTAAVLDPKISISRALNTATRINSSGYIETVAANNPRFDYDPITLGCRGLLIEEARSNLLIYSEDFTNAKWPKVNASISSNAIASPGNTLTADKLVEDTATGEHNIYYNLVGLTAGATYTQSIYAKAAGRTIFSFSLGTSVNAVRAFFDLVNKTATIASIGTGNTTFATITDAGNGWFRCVITGFIPAVVSYYPAVNLVSTGTTTSYTGDGTSGIYIWGAQLEAGAFPTSYIPTTSSTVTRNADVATITGTNFSDWWQANNGGVLVRARPGTVSGTRPWVQFDDGTANEVIALRGNTINPELYIVDNGTPQAQIDAGTIAANTDYSLTGWWQTNDCKARLDNGAVVTDTTATIPTVTQARLGSDGTNYLNGHLASISYYDTFSGQIYTRRKNKAVFSLL